ncbi:MAG: ribulose-phosphate 3-epimerase [Clostridia bacterium]|nr:ribulose-phosphate 3-epimerase [Clostridia bacterium]
MKKQIAPSIMCVSFFELGSSIRQLEMAGAEYIHIDIMDGSFVPNYTLGTDFVKALKRGSNIPLDIHLMIDEPERKIEWFEFSEGDYVSVHAESTKHLHRAIMRIKEKGAKAMVAINPATPICMVENVLDDIDAVLIMTVNPGYAGQKLVSSTLGKIKKLRKFLDDRGYEHIEIEVDGNVSFENARLMSDAGADIFVAGSSSVFSQDYSLCEGMQRLRESIK